MNKNLFKLSLWLLSLCFVVVACDDDDNVKVYDYVTESGSTNAVLSGLGHETYLYGDEVLFPLELDAPIYIEDSAFCGRSYTYAKVEATRLDAVTDVPVDAVYEPTAPIKGENTIYVVRYSTMFKNVYFKLRIVQIDGEYVTVEYKLLKEEVSPNGNANDPTGADASVTAIEMPRLNSANHFAAHYVTYNGKEMLNYALEWSAESMHSAWVAYTFDELTIQNNVGRTNKYMWDPKMPAEITAVTDKMHTSDGFDKGHILASGDRLFSKEANEQTFYYTNISPMMAALNQGFWGKLESKLRSWADAIPETYDKVYITKGGTANNLLKGFTGTPWDYGGGSYQTPFTEATGLTPKGLGVPKYYFMAILTQKGGSYQAIGFWVEHKESYPKNPSVAEMQACAVSIDQLEKNTGLDFFCNLPDVLEDSIESSLNLSDWVW